MTKRVIYTSEIDWDVAEEQLKEHYEANDIPEEDWDLSERCVADYAYECNRDWMYDEKLNLYVPLDGQVIALADLGFWNGRRSGYKLLDENLNSIFQMCDGYDDVEFWCDRYDVCAALHHHDGSHYITFRELRTDKFEPERIDKFLDKLYEGTATERDISRHTRSLRPKVAKVYGW